jgi:hypothetical protein
MKRYLFLFLLMLMACKKEVIPDPEAALLIALDVKICVGKTLRI